MTQSTQTKDTSSTANTQNYASFQGPALQTAFNAANGALSQAQGAVAPTNYTAQFTPAMMQAFQNQLGYGSNASTNPLVGASTNTATGLTSAGTGAATSGLGSLAGYNAIGGNDYNTAAGNAMVNGANIPGMVQNAMLAGNQNYTDNIAPAIQRNAAGTGNINSTAPSVQQGIVQRGLAEQAAGLSANLQGGLFTSGSQLGAQTANNLNSSNLAQMLGLVSGGNNAAGTGVSAGNSAVGQTGNIFSMANTGASNLNAGNQAGLTNQAQQYQAAVNDPFAALNNYYNIVGNKAWGSSSTGTSNEKDTSTPSLLSDIGAGVGMAGSLFGGGMFGGAGSMLSGLFGGGGGGMGKMGM